MRPINHTFMAHTVTLYNVFRDPDTGRNALYRTVLERTRFMTAKSRVIAAETGPKRVLLAELWIDPVTTRAFTRGENGAAAAKSWLEPSAWRAGTDGADRARFWTLQEEDYIVNGETGLVPATADENALVASRRALKLSAIVPVMGRSGNVHHWECMLV